MPDETPVTIPVDEYIVATEVLLLLHVPPDTELLKAIVEPTHTPVVPAIAAGL